MVVLFTRYPIVARALGLAAAFRLSASREQRYIDETQSETSSIISFTFRHVAPHIRNFTAIVGDSNTKNTYL